MKRFIKSVPGIICLCGVITANLATMLLGGWLVWHDYQTPRFQSLTVELGQPMPDISDFMTEIAKAEKAQMLTPAEQIDMNLVGEQSLTFSYGIKKETVQLVIQDTTAPQVTFCDATAGITSTVSPQDFVLDVQDHSETTIAFVEAPAKPDTYKVATAKIVVTDVCGNQTTKECKIFYVWLRPTYNMELGQQVTKTDLLLDPEKDGDLLDQTLLDEINLSPVGTYTLSSTIGEQTNDCVITIVDTTPPVLELKAISIDSNQTVSVASFISTLSDASGDVMTTFLTAPDCKTLGTHKVVIEAKDINGNVTTAETTLQVFYDTTPPTFSGVDDLRVAKHSTLDLESGVSAWDSRDGAVSFTCDTSKVDTSVAGSCYAIYTATDSSGNKATYRRKITVDHDAEDTAALVASIAANLSSDAEAIRDYVRNNIYYSSNWGGSDPIWYGLKQKTGNCYVHALCFQAFLQAKGYQTQLIWTTDKTHYWNLVYINGTWRHMDSTPSSLHGRYSVMTDAQRYETLSNRDWDRANWPVCE